MVEIKKSIEKAARDGAIFWLGAILTIALNHPWAALPVGAILRGAYDYVMHWIQGD